jgi:hypothetical protein
MFKDLTRTLFVFLLAGAASLGFVGCLEPEPYEPPHAEETLAGVRILNLAADAPWIEVQIDGHILGVVPPDGAWPVATHGTYGAVHTGIREMTFIEFPNTAPRALFERRFVFKEDQNYSVYSYGSLDEEGVRFGVSFVEDKAADPGKVGLRFINASDDESPLDVFILRHVDDGFGRRVASLNPGEGSEKVVLVAPQAAFFLGVAGEGASGPEVAFGPMAFPTPGLQDVFVTGARRGGELALQVVGPIGFIRPPEATPPRPNRIRIGEVELGYGPVPEARPRTILVPPPGDF